MQNELQQDYVAKLLLRHCYKRENTRVSCVDANTEMVDDDAKFI